jgi:hypothetical protein
MDSFPAGQPRLQLWSCAHAPPEIREIVPDNYRQGWIARVSKTLMDHAAFSLLLSANASRRGPVLVKTLGDGSGLIVGYFAETDLST